MASGSLQHIASLQSRDFGLRRLGTVLRERAWLMFLFALLGGAVATAYSRYMPRWYAATAVITYRADQIRLLGSAGPGAGASEKELDEHLSGLRRMIQSAALLRRVVEANKLAAVGEFGGGLTGSAAVDRAVTQLQSRLRVEVPPNDFVIAVNVRDTVDVRSAELANAVAEELLAENTRARQALLDEVSTKLEGVLRKVREELNTSSGVPAPAGNIPVPAPDAGRSAAELQALSGKAAAAELRFLQAQAAAESVQKLGTNIDELLRVPAIATANAVAARRADYLERKRVFEDATARYRDKHPTYVAAREAWDAVRLAMAADVAEAAGRLREAVDAARTARDQAQREFAARLEAATRPADSPAAGGGTSLAAREVAVASQYHDRVMAQMKELAVSKEYYVSPLTITQPAVRPARSEGPDSMKLTGFGLLVGFVVGLLISLVFGLGDTSLKSVDETERVLGLPVLSVVPRLKDSDTEMAAAEGFRSLRTSISVSSKGKDPRIVLFTSTSPDEGKTFCALNYSVGLAQQGHKTVLIECDLRRPMAAPSLTMVKVDAPGVSDFLKGDAGRAEPAGGAKPRESGLSFSEIRRKKVEGDEPAGRPSSALVGSGAQALDIDEVVQRTEVANLSFVAAGKPVANPTELLGRPRFEQLLNGLLQRYDRVVLDSAPVLGVSETLLLASRVQGVCFVVRGGHTPRNAVLRAVEVLRRADVTVLGTVLNGVDPKHSDPYGQDYYYHKAPSKG